MVYTLCVKRDFIAQHFLIGGDWGTENELHAHHYAVELQLEGKTLDQHNYLVDIVDIEIVFDKLVLYFKDKILNDLPEFSNTNPSIELFARIFCQAFAKQINTAHLESIYVRIWENDIAWAACKIKVT